MTDVASFCTKLNLDEAAVRRVLESETSAATAATPWYVLLLLGLGAWAASIGGANPLIGALRVTFWSALAMTVTAAVGALVGTSL